MRDDDASLVKAVCLGDKASFAQLVSRYEEAMIAIARAYVEDEAAAEEVCQETWLAVHQGILRFRRRSGFKTWLFGILLRQAKRRLTLERRESPENVSDIGGETPLELFSASEEFNSSGEWRSEPLTSDFTPEEELLAKEADGQVRKAIDFLPTQQRVVMTLRHLEGFTPEEV